MSKVKKQVKKQDKAQVKMEADKTRKMIILYLNGRRVKEVKIDNKTLRQVKQHLNDVKTLRKLTSPYAGQLFVDGMPRKYYNSTRLAICRLVK